MILLANVEHLLHFHMEIIFATGNKHKLQEAQQILGPSFVLKTPSDYGITEDIPETSPTIKGNAVQKASYIWDRLHIPCFADDTGLEVDALGGAPGVYSARYAGEGKDFAENTGKLLRELNKVCACRDEKSLKGREARFRCVVALIIDGTITTFDGIAEGHITLTQTGNGGFGYDPVFRPEGFSLSFAELSAEEKNAISHRGKALRLLEEFLRDKGL